MKEINFYDIISFIPRRDLFKYNSHFIVKLSIKGAYKLIKFQTFENNYF